ncbi:CAF1 family ribonuclease [Cardiosporidium cionae]|uniref:Poly(A)-specific ribonuclease PARN n=1 Tax=Cardiosporidium cionae TaxID=476202 RepID=A0ABQ7JCD8_9APIC|nr:CAF1 family ribonuclease [Cardiosporidium cionae]|eukprot:KAF8821641.1 CAF1 family ribonuclease [Cardiosporidium cionae]
MRCSLFNLQSRTVTSIETWNTHLPFLLGAIRKSEFVSIDLELTGLHTRNERFIGVERCYEAHKEGANSFVPLQIGICAARRSEASSRKWILTPSSIYIFPREERVFQVSAGTLSFLRENNFDFNKWISSGVGYIKPKEEKERKWMIQCRLEELKKLKAGIQKRSNGLCTEGLNTWQFLLKGLDVIYFMKHSSLCTAVPNLHFSQIPSLDVVSSEDELFLEKTRLRIEKWISEEQEDTLDLFVESAFQRLLVHSFIIKEFPGIYSLSTRKGKHRLLSLFKSQEELFGQQLEDLHEELMKVDALAGVRKLLDEISVGKKVLVGHNCFYDFLHLYHSFYDSLPDTVSAFKQNWTDLFPFTLDTKNLAESHELLSSLQTPATLKGLCDSMASIVMAQERTGMEAPLSFEIDCLPNTTWSLPENILRFSNEIHKENKNARSTECEHSMKHLEIHGEGYNEDLSLLPSQPHTSKGCLEDSIHEAGFDSMMTSITFLLQCSHILQEKNLRWDDVFIKRDLKQTESSIKDQQSLLDLLPLMINRIRLVKTQPNVINLNGKDDADMNRHLFMYDFPKSWKKWEILKIWAPLCVTISSVDESSCWLVARNDDDVNTIRRIYDSLQQPHLFKLQSYKEYVGSIG